MGNKNKVVIVFICSVILVISLLLFLLIPRLEYAYDSNTDSYYVKYAWGNSEEYTIKDYVNGKPVTKIGDRAFYKKDKIVSINIVNKENLEYIGRLAFSGCSSLENIDLSNVKYIDMNAFEDCYSLKSITLSIEHIHVSTFYDCINLENIKLYNTKTIGSYAFANTLIKEIDLPNTIEKVYDNAFELMNDLEVIYIKENFKLSIYLEQFKNIILYKGVI